MKFVPIIYIWKLVFFVKLIQCEINSTLNKLVPSIILRPYPDLTLTEQAMYDLKNTLRKTIETNDFDGDDDDDDYLEEYDIDIDEKTITTIQSTTSVKSTTSPMKHNIFKSSSSCFTLNFMNLLLLLLLLLLTQRNI
ncbi:unnamed protein product [Rotaria magnacalcarata]|uniref:Uncharacterized protein n=1 Tax=Rotaria magnacalcarata TaxID=392030 RepID=A0A816W3C7_9BILA|nr:unnamed protein product [Rotaria magnacalcarata]CAF2128335.1 unnamed protein product [Rotaria magnacalcarata]